jgi:hypothetical protein
MCVACFDWTGPLGADYEHVLNRITLEGFSPIDSANYYTARAYRAFMRDDATRQRIYWDSARMVTERVVRAEPDRGIAHEELGTIYAGLGRAADAARSLRTANDLYRAHGDTVMQDGYRRLAAATNLMLLGNRTGAADMLARLLADSLPFITLAAVRVDPFWLRLQGVPAFDRLVGEAGP